MPLRLDRTRQPPRSLHATKATRGRAEQRVPTCDPGMASGNNSGVLATMMNIDKLGGLGMNWNPSEWMTRATRHKHPPICIALAQVARSF